MKRIAAVMVLSLLLLGQILWAADMTKVVFVGTGRKNVDDVLLAGFIERLGKDVTVVTIGEKNPARIAERIREINPALVFVAGNSTILKMESIKHEFWFVFLTDSYLRSEGIMSGREL